MGYILVGSGCNWQVTRKVIISGGVVPALVMAGRARISSSFPEVPGGNLMVWKGDTLTVSQLTQVGSLSRR